MWGLLASAGNFTVPERITTDNHAAWLSEQFGQLIRQYNVVHATINPLNSRGNLAESAIKRLQQQLRLLELDLPLSEVDWRLALAIATIATNSALGTDGTCAYERTFARAPSHLYGRLEQDHVKRQARPALRELHARMKRQQHELFKTLFEKQQKSKRVPTKFRVHDWVRVAKPSAKFRRKWSDEIFEICHLHRGNSAIIRKVIEITDDTPAIIKHSTRRVATRLLLKINRPKEKVTPGQVNDGGEDEPAEGEDNGADKVGMEDTENPELSSEDENDTK